MDNAYDFGSQRLIRAIQTVDVLNIFFPALGYSLILDTRHDGEAPPAILLAEAVGSAEARLRSFARLRPQFPLPAQLAIGPWFGSLRAFVELGVYDAIVERWRALGYAEQERDAAASLRRLQRLERRAMRDIISGAASKALWERDGA
ncbi:MAG TPA: hypothetical protein VFW96_22375 [Thermomicrobiales bacterium]|nr:hypothetical protein [Thermomicrobiales bacterium]